MGGSSAEITAVESAQSMARVIATLTPADSGRFLKWTGEDHPW
jgi:hypothetical protein